MTFHFLRPYWFFAILPWVFLCWRLSKVSIADNWRSVCDAHLLPHLLIEPKNKTRLPLISFIMAGLITIFALAGPSWKKQLQPIYRSQLGSVFVLDLSRSMVDSIGTARKIDRARFKILDYLKRQNEGLTALVVYTDEAYAISPMTEDNHTIANLIPSLEPDIMPTLDDDTAIGLKEAGKLLTQGRLNNGNIFLITDKITHLNEAKNIVTKLHSQGYRLYILDMSNQPAAYSEMQELATAGGGEVIALTPNNTDIDKLIAKANDKVFISTTRISEQKGLIWQDDGRVFVFLVIPLALLAFRRDYL